VGSDGAYRRVRLGKGDGVKVREALELRLHAHAVERRPHGEGGAVLAAVEEERLVGRAPRRVAVLELRRHHLHARIEPDRPAGRVLERSEALVGARVDNLCALRHGVEPPLLVALPTVQRLALAARPQLHLGEPALAADAVLDALTANTVTVCAHAATQERG
jgi:hypothetical protein